MEKAILVANGFDCDIHLLYIQPPGTLYNLSPGNVHDKVKDLVSQYKPALNPGLLMSASVVAGNWYTSLKEQVITQHIDLIILPRDERRFPATILHKEDVNMLSLQTQCPVLTVTDDFDTGHLHNIVVPVDDFVPIRKLTAATYLAKRHNAVIHLMGGTQTPNKVDKKKTRSLTRAYQLLSDFTTVKVFCGTQQGTTIAEDTLAYAQQVKADLIVVNSGKESMLRGFFSRWMRKYLCNKSNIPVLTIAPGQ